VDTYNYSDPKELQNGQNPSLMNILNSILLAKYGCKTHRKWRTGKRQPNRAIQNYNSNFHRSWIQEALSKVFNEDDGSWDKGMIKVYDNFTNDYLYANPNNLLVFVENHDTNRFNEIYNNDIRYKMAWLLATVRGIPQLYYGEIGMNGNKDKGDADIRHDFPVAGC
jgi:glycosidase